MRCFIGIPVPADPGQALRDRPWAEGARAVPAADLHLTLAFLGERSYGWARSLWPALAAIAAATPAFDLPLPTVDVFPAPAVASWPPGRNERHACWPCTGRYGGCCKTRAWRRRHVAYCPT
ncbi:hypothetical protein HML84_03445 [Alcanivorax sp. IO_7]|nr:hypothetical protein HML84_03445 [Alcanivorax sp. IO_7]